MNKVNKNITEDGRQIRQVGEWPRREWEEENIVVTGRN